MSDYFLYNEATEPNEIDVLVEQFRFDMIRINSKYEYESKISEIDSKYMLEDGDQEQPKKGKFMTFLSNFFTRVKNFFLDLITAIRNTTKKASIKPEEYFNSEVGLELLEYDIQQVHNAVADEVRKGRKVVQYIAKTTHIDDKKVESFVDNLASCVRKSAVPVALTASTFAAYKACDKKLKNMYDEVDSLKGAAAQVAGDKHKEMLMAKVLTGLTSMLGTCATVYSIYGNSVKKCEKKKEALDKNNGK